VPRALKKKKPAPRRVHRPRRPAGEALAMPPFFSRPGKDPFEQVAWERRTARIEDAGGRVVFEQKGIEVPSPWSALATDLVASRYFAGGLGTKERESSVRALVTRVVRAVAGFVRRDGLLAGRKDVERFEAELATLLLTQRAAFNSPVFFNAGRRRAHSSALTTTGRR
jgi:ribonucleoside-diphosphate reductase alpha chain